MGDADGSSAAPAVKATTAGADIIKGNALLTAGAVLFYSTWALWVKLRKVSLRGGKSEKKIEKDDAPFESGIVDQAEHDEPVQCQNQK